MEGGVLMLCCVQSNRKMSKYETNLASEYYILSILYRKGLNAYLTLGNKKAVDILISNDEDTIITIDVKGIRQKTMFPIDNVSDDKKKSNHFLIFISYLSEFYNEKVLPEIYIVPSLELTDDLIYRNPKGNRQGVNLSKLRKNKDKYSDNWEILNGYGELGFIPDEEDEIKWINFLKAYNGIRSKRFKSRDLDVLTKNKLSFYEFIDLQTKYQEKFPIIDYMQFISDFFKYETINNMRHYNHLNGRYKKTFEKVLNMKIKNGEQEYSKDDLIVDKDYNIPQNLIKKRVAG